MALHRRMHILHLSLVMVVVVTILLGTPTPTTAQSLLPPQLALPDCPDHCGNLTIPYPFGIGYGCYRRGFNITCNYSTQPPTAFLSTTNIAITNISLYDGELQIPQFTSSDCYDAQGNPTRSNSPWLWVDPPYTISETKNVFVAVGCDTYAFFIGYRGEEEYTTGCMSQCDNLGNAIDQRDTCSGVGCCQTKIPSGLKNWTVTLGSFNNYTDVRDSHRCSYAFLVQEGEFNFNSTSFRELNDTTELPAIIDWVIGNESCDIAAKNESTFACKANSYCHNRSSGGYICRCRSGYEGNPYLPGGCQGTPNLGGEENTTQENEMPPPPPRPLQVEVQQRQNQSLPPRPPIARGRAQRSTSRGRVQLPTRREQPQASTRSRGRSGRRGQQYL